MKLKLFVSIALIVVSLCGRGYAAEEKNQPVLKDPVLCPTSNEEARTLYNQGVQLAGRGDAEGALKAYNGAIALDANYCDAMDNLGQLLRSQGKLDEAIYWYKRSAAILPGNRTAHTNLAVAYMYQGKNAAAVSEYQVLLKMNPDDPEGFYGLGTVYMDTGEPDKASENFIKARQLYIKLNSPLVADADYALGMTYYQVKDYVKSIEYLERSLSSKKDDPRVNYYLGLSYLDQGKYPDLARMYLKKAQELGAKIPPEVLREAGL